ncbi:hypothetical protein BDV29DRAFT_192820 [Aspergillus leporis]|uniref:Uncharacterized protein n=1 Tax=Aspergillus leporis TaxID=41062 RepID=A0A5N5WXX1_9EURO|nr:hypothetical protein BDV29DRAFT_192820 [Aspergillus leporis]
MLFKLPKPLTDRIPTRWKWNYEKVDNVESANEKSQTMLQKPPARHHLTVFAGITVLGIAIFTTLGIHQYYTSRNVKSSISDLNTNTCGNSTAEALARGCKFDQLMWAWYPAHCPHYANDLYLNAEPERPWQFYINPYTRQVASEQDWLHAMDNKVRIYGERREHLTHCVFMFLSLGQIIRDGTKYTPRQVEYPHLTHCAEFLLEALRNDTHWYDVQTQAPHVLYNQDC